MIERPAWATSGLLFALSLGVAFAGIAQSATRPVILAFDRHSDEVAIVADFSGKPLRFLLDSAVDPSVIDRAAGAALGLKQSGTEGAIEGVGSDSATAFESALPDFAIAGRKVRRLDVLVTDLGKIKSRYGAPLDGVFGYSLLKDHAVLIDYPANRLTFYDGAAGKLLQRCARAYAFPLRFQSADEKIILVPGLRIGGVELPAFLDTGSSGSLTLAKDDAAIGPIRAMLPEGTPATGVGARGEVAMRRGRLNVPTTLGPFRLAHAQVALASAVPGGPPVNIGNKFLRALGVRLLVDIPGRRVALFGGCR